MVDLSIYRKSANDICCRCNPCRSQEWSGRFFSCKGQECGSWLTEAYSTFPVLERKGEWRQGLVVIGCKSIELWNLWFPYYWQPGLCWLMVESRIHYVKQKEWQEYDTSCFFIKEIFEESTPSKGSKRISLTGLLMLRHRPVKPLRTLLRLASLWIVPTMSIRSSLRFSNGFFRVVHFFYSWYNKLALELSPNANTY